MSYTEFYENGYGVSVISSEFSYGLELAVLRGTEENAEICYDTPITDDVCGHLDSEILAEIIKDVKSLPKPNNCIKCDELSFNTICNTCKGELMCELCGSEEGIRRNDNIHVCDECNDKHPIRALDEEELVSNCCSALFTHPGWPDSDICSDCKEHADIGVDDE